MKTLIVGTGLSALALAHELSRDTSTSRSIVLVDKARGVGGRLATRRGANQTKFDHGAQAYQLTSELERFHKMWLEANLVCEFHDTINPQSFTSRTGMTALAKELARGLQVKLEHKVINIKQNNRVWDVQFENHENEQFDEVIVTAPLPQALALLTDSHIPFDKSLNEISYHKAIVAFVTFPIGTGVDGFVHKEFNRAGLQSITDQKQKGLSPETAWAAYLTHEFSKNHFDQSDEELALMVRDILVQQVGLKSEFLVEIKKWRYAIPCSNYPQKYCVVTKKPFLALVGDAFGGPDLSGAARSALSLANFMKEGLIIND